MMMNKRLIGTVKESRKFIVGNVFFQWISLLANIALMSMIAYLLQKVYEGRMDQWVLNRTIITAVLAVSVRFGCSVLSSQMSYLSSKEVKRTLREMIYQKLLLLGNSYKENVKTSEVIQVAVEGIEQLETYFGAYLPQLFYAMLAPVTLFAVLSQISFLSAIILLICVPMIPITIIGIQRWAKKLLGKYWSQYTTLGDTFLENLQGLTTTKIYQSDAYKHQKMNEESEQFRKITMKVLTMQLNSITVMDLIAYGGAALGVIMATVQLKSGAINLMGCLMIILLAAEFFLPMRMLGSFFHIAMNGMAASDKIFRLLDLPVEDAKTKIISKDCVIDVKNLSFSYQEARPILQSITMHIPVGSFTAIVGESGCGKSTLASIFMGRNKGYHGQLTVGGIPLSEVKEESLMKNITYISHQSYLFQGTVRDNLLLAAPKTTDEEMWKVLKQVNLAGYLESERGLDTELNEKASNLSGGQCQRLALARALLHDSPVYIFDEATSNIDVESENDIMEQIYQLAKTKTVILISHRLANVVGADQIYVLKDGMTAETGTHTQLLEKKGIYASLWKSQQALECFTRRES